MEIEKRVCKKEFDNCGCVCECECRMSYLVNEGDMPSSLERFLLAIMVN